MTGGAPAPAARAATSRGQHLLGIVLVAAIVTAAAVLLTSTGPAPVKREPGEVAAGQRRTARLLAGIPQAGVTLGRPDAPVRIVEFADLQCPFCARFSNKELEKVVRDDVRTGRARIELRLLDILDRGDQTDSARMAAMAYGAQQQGRLWNFAKVLFSNQGAEGSGYADDAFLRRMATAVPGLNVARALRDRGGPGARAALAEARALADRYDVRGTPTVLVGRAGHRLERLDDATAGAIADAVQNARAG